MLIKCYSEDINDLIVEEYLAKGKALPIGTVRRWGGKDFIKHADGWVALTTGKLTSGKNMAHVEGHANAEDHAKFAKQHAALSSTPVGKAEPKEAPEKPKISQPKEKTSINMEVGKLSLEVSGSSDLWFLRDSNGAKIASVEIYKPEGKFPGIDSIRVQDAFRGKGLGRKILKELIGQYGTVTSDHKGAKFTSPEAAKMWEALGAKKQDGPGALYSLSKEQVAPKKETESKPAKPEFEHLDVPAGLEGQDVTDDEKAALDEYQSGVANSELGGYTALNGFLRDGKPKFGEFTPEEEQRAREVCDNISRAIQKQAPATKESTVYRGLRLDTKDGSADEWLKMKPGHIVADPAFTSTTSKKAMANKFAGKNNGSDFPVMLEIILKPGSKSLDMDKFTDDTEDEILLDRNQKFKVVGVRKQNDGLKIQLETV